MLIFLKGVIAMPVKKEAFTPRKTPSQLRAENEELRAEIDKLKNGAYCYLCGEFKPKDRFYMSSDVNSKSGVTRICRKCALRLACPPDENGKLSEPTKATVMQALEYLDKPFLNKLWDSSYFEYHNPNSVKPKSNIWLAYIKNISMVNYRGMRWKDGDVFKNGASLGRLDMALSSDEEAKLEDHEKTSSEAIQENYAKNKADVISQVGYDPFELYPDERDKPFLYASLNSFIDDETKDDGMKMKAAIQIVKTYNQIEKLNDAIDKYVNDPSALATSAAVLDKYIAAVDKLVRSSATLAKDNGISVNYNNNKSKGANTLSGKVKLLSEIGFRDAQINTFDIETAEGMKQVAALSEQARRNQLGFDENIAQEIKDIKVELVETLTKERDAALESLRLLLVENMDLKRYMQEKGLMDERGGLIA